MRPLKLPDGTTLEVTSIGNVRVADRDGRNVVVLQRADVAQVLEWLADVVITRHRRRRVP
jgi:hypothetical protein